MADTFVDIGEPIVKIIKEAYENKDNIKVDVFRQVKATLHQESGHKFLQFSKGHIDENGKKVFHDAFGISEEDFDFYIEQMDKFRKEVKME
jgi:hypothetical protein